jgi:single-strand DNA-binding protein
MNKIILIGRLVADPQLRYTQSGIAVTNFTLAVDRPYTGAGGNKETDFLDCTAWRKLAEVVANHLDKGRLVAVEGRLEIQNYTDKDGNKRKSAKVICDQVRFLDRGSQEQAEEPPEPDFDDIPF